jgi:capsular polysaccharide transport system permease protein
MRNAELPPKPATSARSRPWLAGLPVALLPGGWLPKRGGTDARLPALGQASLTPLLRFRTALGGSARFLRIILAFIPTIVAVVYFGFIATDRYVSEAKFIVRTAAKPVGLSGIGSFLHMAGIARDQDDVFSVQDFMTSRDAVEQLEEKLKISELYGRPEADFVARYPSWFYGDSDEEFHEYLQWMIGVSFISTKGITTISVQAFRAEDAKAIALGLLDLGEQLVNKMNARIQNDAVHVAADEVSRDEQRLVAAQLAITDFRNKEMMIDVDQSSIIITQLIAKLDADLSQTKAQLIETMVASANSPMITVLRGHIAAVQAQILEERSRISDESTGLARKLADYEKLSLEGEFAKKELSAATSRLDIARVEAQRQQLYLERIVEPNEPDYPMEPDWLRMIASVFGVNALGLLMVWLIFSGIREHVSPQE